MRIKKFSVLFSCDVLSSMWDPTVWAESPVILPVGVQLLSQVWGSENKSMKQVPLFKDEYTPGGACLRPT